MNSFAAQVPDPALVATIDRLKAERDAVILAHYYVQPEVQAVADYVGDSFYLAKLAVELPQKTIVLAGVEFMGESAKLLNPRQDRSLARACSRLSYGPYGRQENHR